MGVGYGRGSAVVCFGGGWSPPPGWFGGKTPAPPPCTLHLVWRRGEGLPVLTPLPNHIAGVVRWCVFWGWVVAHLLGWFGGKTPAPPPYTLHLVWRRGEGLPVLTPLPNHTAGVVRWCVFGGWVVAHLLGRFGRKPQLLPPARSTLSGEEGRGFRSNTPAKPHSLVLWPLHGLPRNDRRATVDIIMSN